MRLRDLPFTIRGLMAVVTVSAVVLTPFAWASPSSRWPLLVAVLTVGSMTLILASPFVVDWLGGDRRLRPIRPRTAVRARTGPGGFVCISVGVLVGIGVAALALVMAGGGHGWNSAGISSVSIVEAPLAGLAWSRRRRRSGLLLAMAVLLGALGFDLMLWIETLREGTSYVARVWNANGEIVKTWAALFVSWQVVAAAVVLLPFRDRQAA